MGYEGVKFTVKKISDNLPSDQRIAELKYWCDEFDRLGFTSSYPGGSNGNLSFRLNNQENSFIITGTGLVSKAGLADDCFVKVISVNLQDKIIKAQGQKEPSSESMMHFAVYQARPEIMAVFHGHSEEILNHATRLNLPETAKKEPYGTGELLESVLAVLGKENFIIMKNHGFLALGSTMKEAGQLTLDIYQKASR